jgi:MarR family transcriptional regulator, 2-MHQ and catechol-resistance regulon repressor
MSNDLMWSDQMSTHYQGTRAERRALDAFIKLARASNSVAAALAETFAAAGLTESQFGVLEALLHLGPLHPRDLAKKLLCSTGNLTLVLDNLEKNGLVRRERGNADRRYVTVHLTPEGRMLIGELFPRHVAAVVERFGVLTAAEQEELGRLCRKLGRREKD